MFATFDKRLCSSLGLIARRCFVRYLWISCILLSATNAAPSVIIFLFVPMYGLNYHDSQDDNNGKVLFTVIL